MKYKNTCLKFSAYKICDLKYTLKYDVCILSNIVLNKIVLKDRSIGTFKLMMLKSFIV